jgi:hypothetical protein
MKNVLRLGIIFALVLTANASHAASLSDREAVAILAAAHFWQVSQEYIPTGLFNVVNREVGDLEKGEIEEGSFKRLKAWESQGLVTIQEERRPDPASPSAGPSDSAVSRVRISATPKGVAMHQGPKEDTRKHLSVQVGTCKLSRITGIEERKIGSAEYRLVTVDFDAQWMPECKAVMQAIRRPVSESRKGIFLMRHDPSQGKWAVMGGVYDTANRAEDFGTSNVHDYLAQQSYREKYRSGK